MAGEDNELCAKGQQEKSPGSVEAGPVKKEVKAETKEIEKPLAEA